MTGAPLVSIVTPSYNQGRYIADALRSVAEQDYPHIEHIVVDAESTDETLDALAPMRDRVTLVRERDDGQGDALNKGFALARGEILGWVNADDFLMPGAVSRAVEALVARPDAAFVHGNGLLVDAAGRELHRHVAHRHGGYRLLVHANHVLQPTTFFTRRRWEQAGPLRTDLHWCPDWDLFLRLARLGPPVALAGDPLATARIHPAAKTPSGGLRRYAEIVRMLLGHRASSWGYAIHAVELVERWWRRSPLPGPRAPFDRAQLAIWRRAARLMVADDGWAGPDVELLPPGGTGDLIVTGSLPEWCPLDSQTLTVLAEGCPRVVRTVGPGPFALRVPGSESAAALSVRSARRFRPDRTGLDPHDDRRLSWMFGAVRREGDE